MKKNLNKTLKALLVLTAFSTNIALADIVGGVIERSYVEEANNNSKLDISFELKLSVDIFQFQGENLESYQREINEDLIAFVNENIEEYKDNFNGFIYDMSVNKYTLYRYNELNVFYKLHSNNQNFFSITVYARPIGGGGNGSRTKAKSFNYLAEGGNGYMSNLDLSDIIKDNDSYLKLLAKINEKLAQREHPLAPTDLKTLFDSSEFAFGKDELIFNFQPYSVGYGADDVVSLRLKYSEIKDIFSEKILKSLNIETGIIFL